MAIWLGLQAIVFAVWAFIACRTLLRLNRRAMRLAGGWPPIRRLAGNFAALFRDPAFARDRRALGWASLALVAVQVVTLILSGRGAAG